MAKVSKVIEMNSLVPEARKVRRRRLIRAFFFGILARLSATLSHALMLAIVIPSLGADKYGLWAGANSAVSWLAMGNFGVSLGLLTQISNTKSDELRRAVTASTFVLLVAISVILLFLSCVSVLTLPLAELFTESEADILLVKWILGCSIIGACAMVPLSIGSAVLQGHQRGDLVALAGGAGTLLGVSITAIMVYAKAEISMVCASLSASLALPSLFQLITAHATGLFRFNVRHFDLHVAKESFRTGLGYFVVSGCGMVFNQSGLVIVAVLCGSAAVASLDVMNRISMVSYALVGALMWPLWPSFGDANASNDNAWVRRVFAICLALAFCLSMIICGVVVFFVPSALEVLYAPGSAPSRPLVVVASIAMVLTTMHMPIQTLLGASGKVRTQAMSGVAQVGLFLVILLLLISELKEVSVPVAQILSMALISLPILGFEAWRVVGSRSSTSQEAKP